MRFNGLFRNPWWIVVGSFFGLMAANITIYQFAFSVLSKPISIEFGWNRSMASSAVLSASFFSAIATPVIGWLIDKNGVKRVTLVFITLFGISIMAMSRAPSTYAGFLLLFSLMGAFSAGQAPLPYAKAISAAFDAKRGLALGIAMTGVGVGTALMPKLAQHFSALGGWRDAFVWLGAMVLAIALPAAALFLRDTGPARRGEALTDVRGLTAYQAIRSKAFWLLAGVVMGIPLVANGVVAHLVPLLTDRGIPANRAVNVFASIGVALIAGRLLSGFLLDKYFGPHVAIVFVLMPFAGLLLLSTTTSETTSFAGAALVGLGLGAEVDLIGYLQSRYLGLRAFGQIYGYLFSIFTLGAGLGPFVMAAAFDLGGSYRPALIGFMGLLLIVIFMLTRLQRQYPFPVEECVVLKPDQIMTERRV